MKSFATFLCLMIACSLGHASDPETGTLPISQKDLSRLYGLELNIIDDHTVEYLHFIKEGYVAATLGTKGGPICAPLLTWTLSKDGVLTIASGNDVQFKWTAIEFKNTEVWVRSNGKVERFSIAPSKSYSSHRSQMEFENEG